jgi:mRNA-degrading endonuclease RelE of RelBE toxin-antitoxin system
MADKRYEIRVAPAAARALKKLPDQLGERVRAALPAEAEGVARGSRGKRDGKAVKAIRGRADRFFRLSVGDYRLMYDVIDEERTLLVLGVVDRRDLERWLRGR